MRAFEDGERVEYVGTSGLGSEYIGREGVVLDSYRDYDGYRVMVRFDGEERGVSFDEEDLEAVKTTYTIRNQGDDDVTMNIALTDREAALVRMVIEGLTDDKAPYAPTLTMIERPKP